MYKIIIIVLLLVISLLIIPKVTHSDNEASSVKETKVLVTDSVFEKIAFCESSNDPHQKNPKSSASGRFQFINSTWYSRGKELWGEEFYNKNIWDYEDNTELAWYVYKKYGTRDWNASINCWGK